jgi:hypothetical protein
MAEDAPNPLLIRWGDAALKLDCDDPLMAERLHRVFSRHLVQETGVTCPELQVKSVPNGYQEVWLDGRRIFGSNRPAFVLEQAMTVLVSALTAQTRTSMVFHAAALAQGQRGLLLVGDQACGKSTLAAWLVASGLNYLTDEVIAVDQEGIEVRGLMRPIVLKHGSAFVWQRWLNEQDRARMEEVEHGTVWLDAELLRQGAVQPTAQARVIVFPQYQPEGFFQARALSPAETAFRLLQRLINAKNLPAHGLPAVKSLTSRVSAYDIAYGEISQEVVSWFRARISN